MTTKKPTKKPAKKPTKGVDLFGLHDGAELLSSFYDQRYAKWAAVFRIVRNLHIELMAADVLDESFDSADIRRDSDGGVTVRFTNGCKSRGAKK